MAFIGLGEAGSEIARDVVAAGHSVRAWDTDPERLRPGVLPTGVEVAASNHAAVAGADIVLSVNWASQAEVAAREAAQVLRPGQLYAELNTGSPAMKRAVAAIVAPTGALFVDVALMSPVPGLGARTPMLLSGPGAHEYLAFIQPFGTSAATVDDQPGSAATRKLLRSIFYKGVASAVVESFTAAQSLGLGEWVRGQFNTMLPDDELIDRLIDGTHRHAKRRSEEMEAARAMVADLGLPPFMAQGARDLMRTITAGDYPKPYRTINTEEET